MTGGPVDAHPALPQKLHRPPYRTAVPDPNDRMKLLRRSGRVDETRIGDRVVLYHRDTGSGVVLNPAGSRIWDSLSTPSSPAELVDRLIADHATTPRATIASDVAAYVTALYEQQLIEDHT